jgi:hypothetical protein
MGQGTTLETRNLRRIAGHLRVSAVEAATCPNEAFSGYSLQMRKVADELDARAHGIEGMKAATNFHF